MARDINRTASAMLEALADLVTKRDFGAAGLDAADLTTLALWSEHAPLVYLSEYLEWLLENAKGAVVKNKNTDAFCSALANWLRLAAKDFPGKEQDFLAGQLPAMISLRVAGTKIQSDFYKLAKSRSVRFATDE